MVVEWIGLGLGIVSLIVMGIVLRYVMKSAAPSVERLEKTTVGIQQSIQGLNVTLAGVEERTRSLTQVSGLVNVINERTQTISSSIPTIGIVEERTRGIAAQTGRLPVIETRLGKMDDIKVTLEDLAGRLKSERRFGKIGEEALEAILGSFPEDTWRRQFVLAGGGRVDFAFFLPNGKIVPIDSKTGGSGLVVDVAKALDTATKLTPENPDRKRWLDYASGLLGSLGNGLVKQAADVGEYIKSDERCLSIGIMAVPDPVFDWISPKTRQACLDCSVEVVPYSLVAPFLNYIRRQNILGESRVDAALASIGKVQQSLTSIDDTLKNSVERASKMLENAVGSIRTELRVAQTMLQGAEAQD